jgi:hypothetical protein
LDKEKLKEMARDKKYISGIYNYCDQWCERCPQTSRCLNFRVGEEEFGIPETRDIHNDVFWNKMSEIMETTIEMLYEMAESMDIDLDALDIDIEKENSDEEFYQNHKVCRMATEYSSKAAEWLDGAGDIINEAGYGSPAADMDITDSGSAYDAFEVIKWYQYQIYTKLMRAVSGLNDEPLTDDTGNEYASDSDGSAKVALIGIDRSIAAWGSMNRMFPGIGNNEIKDILVYLGKLRKNVEKTFPNARNFIRPGFDTYDLNS